MKGGASRDEGARRQQATNTITAKPNPKPRLLAGTTAGALQGGGWATPCAPTVRSTRSGEGAPSAQIALDSHLISTRHGCCSPCPTCRTLLRREAGRAAGQNDGVGTTRSVELPKCTTMLITANNPFEAWNKQSTQHWNAALLCRPQTSYGGRPREDPGNIGQSQTLGARNRAAACRRVTRKRISSGQTTHRAQAALQRTDHAAC